MNDELLPLHRLLESDRRYPLEAYQFIRDALAFAQEELQMGQDAPGESGEETAERHLTGQELCEAVEAWLRFQSAELCEAIRVFALDQYGYMARVVLARWGLTSTADFGNVVYNLIGIGWMKKSRRDRQEHFHDVYDFQQAFVNDYQIHVPD